MPKSPAPISIAPGLVRWLRCGSAALRTACPVLPAKGRSISSSSTPDKPGTPGYFQWAVKLSRRGSLIIVDNVVREGAVLDADGDANVQGMRRFFELAATDPRVSGTALQTVGAKGHDGLSILLVTAGPQPD